MVSYSDVEAAHRAERSSPVLQELPPDFYLEAKKLAASPEVGQYAPTILKYLEEIFTRRVNLSLIHI